MSEYKPLEKDVHPKIVIDAKGLFSPMPILRLKRGIAELHSQEILKIDCTDRSSADDIENWCLRKKHTYLGEVREPEYSSFFIKKS